MWMEWAGWNFVSAALTALGLAALGFAWADLYRRRRRIAPVELVLDNVGRAYFNDEPVDVMELSNNGSEDIRVLVYGFVSAEPRVTLDYRVPGRLASGQSARFTVAAADLSESWMLLVWRSMDDRRWFRVQWFPLLPSTQWTKVLTQQRARVPRTSWWHPWPYRLPIQPVGPETIEIASVRVEHRNRERMNQRLGKATSFVRTAGGDLYSHGRILEVTEDTGDAAGKAAPSVT